MKIDFVFLYVNGHDPKHIKKKNKYFKEEYKIYNPVLRYENIEEIKYSVNSILKNLSWINKIYIVTDNQIPPVNPKLIETGKVIVIDHKQIIPKKYLPTFSTCVIQSYIHNIPGLSEIFLYGDDDYFCLSKMEKSDFVRNNKLIIYSNKYSLNKIFCNSFLNEYGDRIYITAKLLKKNIINDEQFINSHQIKIFRKKTLKKIENVFSYELDDLRKNKFRNNTTIHYHFLVINYEQYLNNNILMNLDYNNSLFVSNKKSLQILFFFIKKKIINKTFFFKKKFICINSLDLSLKDKFIDLMKLLKLY